MHRGGGKERGGCVGVWVWVWGGVGVGVCGCVWGGMCVLVGVDVGGWVYVCYGMCVCVRPSRVVGMRRYSRGAMHAGRGGGAQAGGGRGRNNPCLVGSSPCLVGGRDTSHARPEPCPRRAVLLACAPTQLEMTEV